MSKTKLRTEELPPIPITYAGVFTMTATGTLLLIPAGQHPRMRLLGGGVTTIVAGS